MRGGFSRAVCGLCFTIAGSASLGAWSAAAATTCDDLKRAAIPDTTVQTAQAIPAGSYTTADHVVRQGMPAFCRVVASVRSAPDSDILVEMWLPQTGWTGVFHANGNGGYGGDLSNSYDGLEAGLKRGYASAATDMGTAPSTPLDGDPLIGHPQKWKDWGLLSTHVMAVVGKDLVQAFYGEKSRRAYYTGCSTGGQEGLIEAERFPADFDGILAGAPVVSRTHLHTAFVWDYRAATAEPGHKLSPEKLTLLHQAVLAACGPEKETASDPFLGDPSRCAFNPATLACHGAAASNCLTGGEVATAAAFYEGPRDPRTGRAIYRGWPVGSELGWLNWSFLETPIPPTEPAFDALFKWAKGAGWDWRDFDFDKDQAALDATLGPDVNGATAADLGGFERRGGKLILFHGLADSIVNPYATIAFYQTATHKLGSPGSTDRFARLFLVPGMAHCSRGEGPNAFNSSIYGGPRPPSSDADHDVFTALARWVEQGKAPARIVATKFVDNDAGKGIAMQRPLCPYPLQARYRGAGDQNDANNFACAPAP